MSDNNIYKNISELYTKGGYFTRYAGDFWVTLILCLIVFIIISYYWMINNIKPIVNDWSNQKCNPAVIPFAGMINAPEGTTAFDYTAQNFEQCTQSILGEIAQYSFSPIYYLLNSITGVFAELSDAMTSMRGMFDSMRSSVSDQGDDLYARSLNITIPILTMLRKVGAILGKTQGTITSGIYTLFGGFIITNSLFATIYEAIIDMMYAMVTLILVCFAIGFLFPPTLAIGVSIASFMAILLIPVAVMIILLENIYGAAGMKSPPLIPGKGCFAGVTPIKLQGGDIIQLKDILPGNVLECGSIVTATMKSDSSGCKMCNLDGILVTTTHKIFIPGKGWSYAYTHPLSVEHVDYADEFIYCISTTSKTFTINKYMFADWDEVNEDMIQELATNKELRLPHTFLPNQIHEYLEGGLHPDTIMTLYNGSKIKIHNLKVNDILKFGEKISTIIKIKTDDINYYTISHNNKCIITGTDNTEVMLTSLDEGPLTWTQIPSPEISYHIITNKKGYNIDGAFIGDYNRGIDRYLSDKVLLGYLD